MSLLLLLPATVFLSSFFRIFLIWNWIVSVFSPSPMKSCTTHIHTLAQHETNGAIERWTFWVRTTPKTVYKLHTIWQKTRKSRKKTTAIAHTRCGIFSVRERESMINLFIYPLLPSSRSVIASKQTIRNWNSSCNYSVSRAQTRTQTHGQIDQTNINASNGCIAAYKQQK